MRGLEPVKYKGTAVMTFPMIDELHGQPSGTAELVFRHDKDRFVPGEDYLEISTQEMDELFDPVISSSGGVLITECGYIKAIMTFEDDLAWAVWRHVVERILENRDSLKEVLREHNRLGLPRLPSLEYFFGDE